MLTKRSAWTALKEHYEKVREVHLRSLFADDSRRGCRPVCEGWDRRARPVCRNSDGRDCRWRGGYSQHGKDEEREAEWISAEKKK